MKITVILQHPREKKKNNGTLLNSTGTPQNVQNVEVSNFEFGGYFRTN
jgi:hypothetical protein